MVVYKVGALVEVMGSMYRGSEQTKMRMTQQSKEHLESLGLIKEFCPSNVIYIIMII